VSSQRSVPVPFPVRVPPVVVMGVSGCGKSTVGELLARHLGVPFLEGDGVHPAANVARMAAGHPLDDEARIPWLDRIGAWLALDLPDGGGVAACSALARRYRDRLRAAAPATWFLHLDVDRETVTARMGARRGHFMPVSLIDSQLETLEPLGADERGLRVAADLPVPQILAAAATALGVPLSGPLPPAGD